MGFTLKTRGLRLSEKKRLAGSSLYKSGHLWLGTGPRNALGWKAGDRIDLFLGDGADINRICLRKNENGSGYTLFRPNVVSPSLAFASQHLKRAFPYGARETTWAVEDGALYITVVPREAPAAKT